MFSIWILKKSWLDFLTGSTEYYPSFKIKHPCLFPVVINPLASNVESSMSWRVKEWTPRHWPDVKFKKKTKRSFPWIRHFGHMVLATTFFLIDLLALDGRCGRNDAGCFNFPMTFFPGTQFKLGQPESPGKLYFVYYHASIDPMQLNPGYEMEHP